MPDVDSDYDSEKGEYRKYSNCKTYIGKHFPGVTAYPQNYNLEDYRDQWRGAAPDVSIIDISADNSPFDLPYGFSDLDRKTRAR